MTTWYTEAEAAAYLKVPEAALKLARYRKKVKARKICRVVQYMQEWLDEFREGKCEDNRNSSNVQTLRIGSSTSRKRENSERSALVRAKQIVAKQKKSLDSGSSNAKSLNSQH